MTPLFDAQWFGTLAMHTVAGFETPIPIVCYRGEQLRSPFPLGALGTGYLELRGDGRLGLTSIANSFVPQQQASGTLLTFTDSSGKATPLDADHAEIVILAHFPVLNVRYTVGGKFLWLRAFVPMIPGDSKASNTPGIVFEISADQGLSGKIRIDANLSNKVAPTMVKSTSPPDLPGANLRFIQRNDFRSDITLAWIDGATGTAQTPSNDQMVLSIETDIQGGETRRAVLAWFFPWFIDAGGEPHMNRYASHFRNSIEVAQLLAKDHGLLLKRILAWQNSIYQSGQPDWICNALVQSLYSYAKNSMWVDEHRTDRWYEPEGFFTHSESNRGCPITETMVCRAHGHLPTLLLWPELERTTLAGFAHFQLRSGEVAFSFGMPYGLRDPRYHCQHPLTSSQFIQQVHRYFIRTGDEAFVNRLWPNVVDAMKFCQTLDYDDDGLINEHAH
ncbi:MAG TPA: GH116 family glycosyl hydrolase, partial [Tepidisphaeraceae bacterium]|nr:GH116 family glycosyl hydrolase [Tepidisphaeraceae bacterium]